MGAFFKYAGLMQEIKLFVFTVLNSPTVSQLWQFGFFALNVITQNHSALEI